MAEQTFNLRYDATVHAQDEDGWPICGDSMIPACAPEVTLDAVTCIWCDSIIN